MLKEAKQQLFALPLPVQFWMRWLNIIFLTSLFFVGSDAAARWALVAYSAAFPIGILTFYLFKDIRLTGLAHLLCWTPLVIYLLVMVATNTGFNVLSFYGVWTLLLCATVSISLILDLWAVVAVLMRLSTVRTRS